MVGLLGLVGLMGLAGLVLGPDFVRSRLTAATFSSRAAPSNGTRCVP